MAGMSDIRKAIMARLGFAAEEKAEMGAKEDIKRAAGYKWQVRYTKKLGKTDFLGGPPQVIEDTVYFATEADARDWANTMLRKGWFKGYGSGPEKVLTAKVLMFSRPGEKAEMSSGINASTPRRRLILQQLKAHLANAKADRNTEAERLASRYLQRILKPSSSSQDWMEAEDALSRIEDVLHGEYARAGAKDEMAKPTPPQMKKIREAPLPPAEGIRKMQENMVSLKKQLKQAIDRKDKGQIELLEGDISDLDWAIVGAKSGNRKQVLNAFRETGSRDNCPSEVWHWAGGDVNRWHSRPGAKSTHAADGFYGDSETDAVQHMAAQDKTCAECEAETVKEGDKWLMATDPAVGKKIGKLMDEGYPQKQAIAIALDMKRRGEI